MTKRKPDAEKKKGGRPNKFDALDLDQVRKLAERGLTDAEMSDFFGVALSTWHKWKKDFPEFSDSLKDWKNFADSRVERSLYERAIGFSHIDTKLATHEGKITDEKEYIKHHAPDTTACIFWLKNRDKENWRDKIDHEHGGPGGGPIETTDVTKATVQSAVMEIFKDASRLIAKEPDGSD